MMIDGKTCMLARAPKGTEKFDGWVLEPKYDGHRMIATIQDGNVRMYARSGRDKTGHLPNVEAALANLPNCVIDGEVVARDGSWGRVQEILGSSSTQAEDLVFVVFDVLITLGQDVRGRPLKERRAMLDLLLQHIDVADGIDPESPVALSPQFPFDRAVIDNMIAEGWEGCIAKNPTSTYVSGSRSRSTWFKFKAVDTVDVVVTGATPGQGKYTNMIGALTFGQYVNGQLKETGRCSGMTDAERETFTRMLADGTLVGTVIEVAHMGIMPTGGMRHPQYKRTRTDKMPEECVA